MLRGFVAFSTRYLASKHALEGWSDCLRLELHQFNIKVVIIEPGAIVTEFLGITTQPMLDRSKGGPYEEKVSTFVRNFEDMTKSNSPPTVTANDIS